MQTRVSTKGQVVLPGPIRRRFGIQPGDQLDILVEEDRIVLAPRARQASAPRIVTDPISGMPVIDLGRAARIVTNEQVEEILAEFP